MLINELSRQTGVTVHTIRYYENLGLISGKSDEQVTTNNYKNYDQEAVERLEIIRDAKEVGFTLTEIKKILESWYGSSAPYSEQIELFKTKIIEIDAKIKHLKQVKKRLEMVKTELEKGSCE